MTTKSLLSPTTGRAAVTVRTTVDGTTDNTAAIQAALTAAKNAGGGEVVLPRATSPYIVTSALVISSHTRLLVIGKDTQVKLVSGSTDHNFLINENCYTGRNLNDGVTTASSTTLTSATAAFTSADVGQPIRVWGAGPFGTWLDTTISAVTNATTVTLAAAATNSLTSASFRVGVYDSDIAVEGGYWYRAAIGGAPAWMHQHGILFRHADRVSVEINRAYTGSGKYTIAFGDGHHFNCALTRTVEFDAVSDGVHITGPASHIAIGTMTGALGDDSVSLTPGDHSTLYGTGTGDTQGEIRHVTIGDIHRRTTTAGSCLKIAGSDYGYTCDSVHVRKLRATNTDGGGGAFAFNNDVGDVYADNIVIDNAYGKAYWQLGAGTVGHVRIGRWSGNGTDLLGQVFNGTIDKLEIASMRRKGATTNAITVSGGLVNALKVRDWDGDSGNVVYVLGGSVNSLMIDGARLTPATHSGSLVTQTVTSLGTGLALSAAADTVTKTSHGLTAGQVVSLQSNTATGVSNNVAYYVVNPTANTFQLATTAGGAAVDITADGTATVNVGGFINEIHLSNVDGVAASFLVNVATGTTDLYCANVKAYQLLSLTNTATVTVFGDVDEFSSSGSSVSGSGVLYCRTFGWRTDISTLKVDNAGFIANNRSSGLSCGLGPVFAPQANRWVNIATGATYDPAGLPTVAAQSAAGTGASAVFTGTAGYGSGTLTTGTGATSGDLWKLTFLVAFTNAPKVLITPTNAAAAAAGLYVSAKATGSFTVAAANAPASSMALTFDYEVKL